MVETAADVGGLVARELALIRDVLVREALAERLTVPVRHLRAWDYGANDEQYPCWTIVEDQSSDSAIVYSEHGHGPKSPWGLVSLSSLWFGMDAGWFRYLEDAFVDSPLGADLRIWNVVTPDGRIVHASLSLDDAFARRSDLDGPRPRPLHRVVYRSGRAEGVR